MWLYSSFATDIPKMICSPSPCGPYSECSVSANGAAACSCRPGHIGSPPSCRPECLVSSECKLQLACIDRRCRDPCEGACGRDARCQVIAHSPICTCNDGYTGDPFTYCYPKPGRQHLSHLKLTSLNFSQAAVLFESVLIYIYSTTTDSS